MNQAFFKDRIWGHKSKLNKIIAFNQTYILAGKIDNKYY